MNDPSNPLNRFDRRSFLKKSTLGAGLMVVPSFVAGQSASQLSPNNRLNIAIVGVGGKGRGPTIDCIAENVVALCDVDDRRVADQRKSSSLGRNAEVAKQFDEAIKEHERRGARWFKDYRVMFEEMGDQIDAVIVSIPDFMHFPVALSAVNLGKHIYCEKPLTHTMEEARLLAQAAAKQGVVSQMGNQGHSNNGTRLVKEWIEGGVIGEVREVHSWTNRPVGTWAKIHGTAKPDHSKGAPEVPPELDWDIWQGISERREYDPSYLPFSWRGFVDYGCGSLGDMACHIMDSAYWGLSLGSPTRIAASTSKMTGYTFPVSSIVTFDYPARGKMPPVTYKWYDGGMFPAVPKFLKGVEAFQTAHHPNGSLIIGEGAAILTSEYSETVKILPDATFKEVRSSLPERRLRRIKGSHLQEFFNAIRENRPASSDFSYAGPFTETVLLGVIAQRLGRELQFDGNAAKFIGDEESNALLKKTYPNGWILS